MPKFENPGGETTPDLPYDQDDRTTTADMERLRLLADSDGFRARVSGMIGGGLICKRKWELDDEI